jgi:putative transcriptional regulator
MSYASDTSAHGFLEGKLLIALPGMPDPRFEQSVVYMCAHNDDGAMGVIINKPIEGLSLPVLLEKLSVTGRSLLPEAPVLFGGPVQTGRGFVLHSSDYASAEQSVNIATGIALTATIDILRAIADGTGPRKSLMVLGYAGWGEGQIESEIKANGWLHCDADQEIVFDTPFDDKWRLALAKLGADISGLSGEAGRA